MDGLDCLTRNERKHVGWFKQFNLPLVSVLFLTLAATKIHGCKNSLSELHNAKSFISHTSSDQKPCDELQHSIIMTDSSLHEIRGHSKVQS